MAEHPGYDYLEVEVVDNITQSANQWGDDGWETISVIPPLGLGKTVYSLLLKRRKRNPYDQLGTPAEYRRWAAWEKRYGTKFDRGNPEG